MKGGGAVLASVGMARGAAPARAGPAPAGRSWDSVRARFALEDGLIHLGALFIVSHPQPVREAIERHRRGLDENPVRYLLEHGRRLRWEVALAAAEFWGTRPEDVALTDSTTMGLGILYNGLRLTADDEVITTQHDHYSTRESLRLKAKRSGARIRTIRLYEQASTVSEDALVQALMDAVGPRTRAVALTWVHSDTGLKLPLRTIAGALRALNAERPPREHVLLCVDGVHGFGVEDVRMADLGCDFFVAGCHKWLFGPRGTGVLYAARPALWKGLVPTIPPFGRGTPGLVMTPGGFHSFEHRWALAAAFRFQQEIGRERIASRTRALAEQLKQGLSRMRGVRLHTPLDASRSAGIVSFDVEGMKAAAVVRRLLERGIVITQAPYGLRSARATPSILNTPEEIEQTLRAIHALA